MDIKDKSMFYFKLILAYILVVSSVYLPGLSLTEAEASEIPVVSIELPKKEVDIIFTIGKTNYSLGDLNSKATTLKNKLAGYGINANITSLSTSTIATDSSDASVVYDNWTSVNIPQNFSGSISGGSKSDWNLSGGYVLPSGNYRPARGFINPSEKAYSTRDAEFSFNWGIHPTNYGSFAHGEAGFLFGMEDYRNYYAYIMDNHSACGNILYDGAEALVKVTNGNRSIISTNSFPMFGAGQKRPIKITIKGNNIQIVRDGSLRFNYTDNAKTQITGTYGFYVWDQLGAYFNDISVDSEVSKLFEEVITEPQWRTSTEKMILNIGDDFLNSNGLNDMLSRGRVVTYLASDDINISSIGDSASQTPFRNFLTHNSLTGNYYTATSETSLNTALNTYADYVVQYLADKAGDSGAGIIVNSPVQYKISNAFDATEFGGKPWKLSQNANYYENGNGRASFHNEYLSALPNVFDKVGQYRLTYADGNVNPVYLYVHREPVAILNAAVTKSGSTFNVNLSSSSYDIDKISSSNSGIASEEWRYKLVSASGWTNGKLSGTLSSNSTYLVQLRVKDTNGAYSKWDTKVVTSEGVNVPPISRFTLPKTTVWEGESVNISNLSFSPNGTNISTNTWEIRDVNGVVKDKFVNNSKDFTYNFKNAGLGITGSEASKEYKIALKVKDAAGLESDYYIQTVTIESDTTPPNMVVSPSMSDWTKNTVTVNMDFEDLNGSGFDSYRTSISTSSTNPGTYTSWIANTFGSVSITDSGIYYLHVEAKDKRGNLNKKVYGPYKIDKTAPVSPVITLSETKWTSPVVTFKLTDKGDGSGSGIQSLQYRINGGSWTNYSLNTNVSIPAHLAGEIDVESRAIDKVGNISSVSKVIAYIDDKDPVINSVVVKTVGNKQQLVVDAIDYESGIKNPGYQYHQKIVGVDSKFNIINGGFINQSIIDLPQDLSATKYLYKAEVEDGNKHKVVSNEVAYVSAPIITKAEVKDGDFDNTYTFDFKNKIGEDVNVKVIREGELVAILDGRESKFVDAGLDYERDYNYEFIAVTTFNGKEVSSLSTPVKITIGKPTLEVSLDSKEYYNTTFSDDFKVTGNVVYRKGGAVSVKLIKGGNVVDSKVVNVLPYAKTQWSVGGIQTGKGKTEYTVELDLVGFENMKVYKREYQVNVSRINPNIRSIKDSTKYNK